MRLLDPKVMRKPSSGSFRLYYGFNSGMKVDRYNVGRRAPDLSVRELNLNGLSAEQQTWVNQHRLHARLRRGRRLR